VDVAYATRTERDPYRTTDRPVGLVSFGPDDRDVLSVAVLNETGSRGALLVRSMSSLADATRAAAIARAIAFAIEQPEEVDVNEILVRARRAWQLRDTRRSSHARRKRHHVLERRAWRVTSRAA
jgi:hypothetical protein